MVDSEIKFLRACFVIRNTMPRRSPRGRKDEMRGIRGEVEETAHSVPYFLFASKTKAKVNRSRRGTIDRAALFIRDGGSNISNQITAALLLRQIRRIYPHWYLRCDSAPIVRKSGDRCAFLFNYRVVSSFSCAENWIMSVLLLHNKL